jgi:hypothetical protein
VEVEAVSKVAVMINRFDLLRREEVTVYNGGTAPSQAEAGMGKNGCEISALFQKSDDLVVQKSAWNTPSPPHLIWLHTSLIPNHDVC